MKRLLAVFLLAGTLFTLCACPGGDPTPTPGGDGKCPTCGKDPCECNPEGCPVCGQNPCVCPPPDVDPVYAQTYPYTDDDGVLHIRYQDTYTFDFSIRDIKDVRITSTVTGTIEKDPNLLVKQKDGRSVYADGCGSATVVLLGNREVKVQVDPSPINMLFVTGQSNAAGDPQSNLKPGYYEQYANDYIRSPETMAYFTWTGQQLSIDVEDDNRLYNSIIQSGGTTLWGNQGVTFVDYRLHVPTTLDWETVSVQKGANPKQFSIPKGQTTSIVSGWCAALAYEWIEQTGERVWIVNCSQGGMEIQQFQPSDDGSVINNEYYQAVKVFNLALETLYKEVDAGHFVLNHMAYYWFHGESNSQNAELVKGAYNGWDNRFKADRGNRYLTAEEYTEYFIKMHKGFQRDVVYNHNGVEKKLEYCGVMVTRCSDSSETKNTFEQVILRGPRAAQYYMGASQEEALKNVYLVSNITEQWIGETYDAVSGNPEADAAVEAYFLKTYGSPAKFKQIFGYDMPTTVYEVHPGVHYLMHGHNEMGMDCARNSLRIINLTMPENCYKLDNYDIEDAYAIKLINFDGRTELASGDTIVFDKNTLQATVCPQITPLYQQVQGIHIEITDGNFTFDSNVFEADSNGETFLQFKMYVGGKLYGEYAFNVEFR